MELMLDFSDRTWKTLERLGAAMTRTAKLLEEGRAVDPRTKELLEEALAGLRVLLSTSPIQPFVAAQENDEDGDGEPVARAVGDDP